MNGSTTTPKLAYSVPETMAALGIGRNSVYNLINSGKLRSVKVGARTLVPASAIAALLEGGEAA